MDHVEVWCLRALVYLHVRELRLQLLPDERHLAGGGDALERRRLHVELVVVERQRRRHVDQLVLRYLLLEGRELWFEERSTTFMMIHN